MLDWLLLFAGANLAMGVAVALPSAVRRPHAAQRLALAAVPALCALLMAVAFLSFRATMPPEFALAHPGFVLGALDHGDAAATVWDHRVGAASALAFWLTAATLLGLIVLWLACSIHARQRRGRIA